MEFFKIFNMIVEIVQLIINLLLEDVMIHRFKLVLEKGIQE
jgi:hypothetical protein